MTDQKASLLTGVSDDQFDEMTRVVFAVDRAATEELNVARLRALAEKRATDPTIFEERPPWFFRAVASTYVLDSYFTRMDKNTTMKLFAADMSEGRALLIGHETRSANLGMSLRGQYEAHGYLVPDSDPEERVPWTVGDYYMLRGKEPQESMIDAFRAGTQDRFSVGFSPGWWRCELCKRDLFSYDCPHIPGRYYDPKSGKPSEEQGVGDLAFADVVDAHLRELSTVYSNATPGATLLKAQRMVEMGEIHDWKTVRHLEALYRHKMPGSERSYQAVVPDAKERDVPTEKDKPTELQGELVEITGAHITREEFKALGLPEDMTAAQFIADYKIQRQGAAEVEGYRKLAIEEALVDGRRALGENFNEERATRMLEALPLVDIAGQRKDWSEAAAKLFGQGRQTIEQPDLNAAKTEGEADRREQNNVVKPIRQPRNMRAYRA